MYFHRYSDLCVSSNVEIKLLPVHSAASAEIELIVRAPNQDEARLVEETAKDLSRSELIRRCFPTRGGHWLQQSRTRAFQVGGHRLVDGMDIGGVIDPLVGEFLDHVMPRLLSRMGRFLLHASCVAYGDEAVVFLGPSGRGKSTLALAHCELQGAELVADDAVELIIGSGRLEAKPTYRMHRVWDDTLEAVSGDGREGSRHPVTGKVQVTAGSESPDRAYSIIAVCVVEEEVPGSGIRIRQLARKPATLELLRQVFYFPETLSKSQLHLGFDRCERVFEAVPCLGLQFPREWNALSDTVKSTLRLWRTNRAVAV